MLTTHTVVYTSSLNVIPTVSHYVSDQEAHDAAYHFLEVGQYNRAVGACDATGEQCFELRRTAVRIAEAPQRFWYVEVIGSVSDLELLGENMALALREGTAIEATFEEPPIPRRPVRSVDSVAEYLDDIRGFREEEEEEPPYGWRPASRFGTGDY